MKKDLHPLRHTCEHVLHCAMQNLYSQLKKAMGPATAEGFYFDFDLDEKINEADFPKIEKEMQRLIDKNLTLKQEYWTPDQAKKFFKDNPYKLDWLEQIKKRGEKISIYRMGGTDVDLCSGPHVKSTAEIKAFKLLSVAGAYWHGDETKKMLTRIYGTAFPTKKELDQYLANLEEAKKRDHRLLGKNLQLFTLTNAVGPGLVLWTPKGAIIRHEIENFIYQEQVKRGYQHVYSPHIGKQSLWQTSGHWDLYRDKMYSPMKIDQDSYLIKPMNCPFHMMIYQSQKRSYRDLPLRLAEIASVYRYEKPGELSGMLRVRYITQDDSHIFCTPDQAISEFIGVFDYTVFLLKTFGITDYYLRLGIRSPQEKYLGSELIWEKAQDQITKAVEKIGIKFITSPGEAAFYGPKLDVMVKDVLGREWQCGTIQLDFMLPERFKLEYTDKNGQTKQPVLIHRAPLGSLERWLAVLIEHYNGAFPLWLAPVQVIILPVAKRHLDYAHQVLNQFQANNIRAELDETRSTLNAKIRQATLQKIPYLLVVGDKETKTKSVAKRDRQGKDYGAVKLNQFIADILREIATKAIS